MASKTVDVCFGVCLGCVVLYILNQYISWIPDLDIYSIAVIIVLNLAQLVL